MILFEHVTCFFLRLSLYPIFLFFFLAVVLNVFLVLLLLDEEVRYDVHGHGEDHRRVLLRRDRVQRLEISELRNKGMVKCLTTSNQHSIVYLER